MDGKFVISLDFELHWGGAEKWDINSKNVYFENTVKFIPELLELFYKNRIKATWATVGFLFAKDKEQLINFSPKLKPTYNQKELSYYNIIPSIGKDEKSDPFHYAPSLIDLILKTPGQELATHTFTHYYCNEPGQTVDQFDADIKAAQQIAQENFGVALKSLVLPRNQFNEAYLEVAHKNGIKVLRSNPNVWFWNNDYGKLSPLLRAADTLLPISKSLSFDEIKEQKGVILLPASRFFRTYKSKERIIQRVKMNRIKREMTYAAKHGVIYHLWWHPHNLADDIENNRKQLIEILEHFKILNDKYNFSSVNMGDFIEE
jgi:peptidoglycan/xylan/chitin deacetylase (PgdA/CDA1 family)